MQDQHLDTLLPDPFFRLNVTIRTEQTRKQYRIALRDFESALGHRATINDMTDDNVASMMRLLCDRDLAPKTVNERRGRIHTFWTWLARRGYCSRLPTTPRIPEPVRTPTAWTKTDLLKLIAACRDANGWVGLLPAARWWTSLHLIAWDSGERIGALMQLPWHCVDLDSAWILIPAELRKGRRNDRGYKISSDSVDALREIRQPVRKLVWPWPYHETYLWAKYKALLRSAGLPADRKRMFHCMRRSVASHLEAAGQDATAFLGHCTRRVTEAYLDPRIVPRVSGPDVLFRLQPPRSAG
jgi:integrase